MAAPSHNHANYQARLDYVRQVLLANRLGLSSKDVEHTEITPIQYDPDCPFKYNNFVYRLVLPAALSGYVGDVGSSREKPKQPGCVPVPEGTREFILRLSNPDTEGMYQEIRVQNEVAILALASAALRHIEPNVVPRVFGWGRASSEGPGWILQELMPGLPLAEPFGETMTLDQKKGILAQMARMLKALQDYALPESVRGWGGVTFDEDSGVIVSARMASVGAGPWSSLEESYKGRLEVALAKADENPILQGWRPNGIRERVDDFIKRGLPAQFAELATKQDRVVVHADFTPDNLLYDPTTGRVTALLDYDFASLQHPAYEFFRSFGSSGGQFLGWTGDTTPQEKEAELLRLAKLTGQFPSPLPAPVASDHGGPGADWELAQAWEDELRKLDVRRPSTIRGVEKVADVDEILGALLPWRLTNEDFLRMNQDEDQRKALRRMGEARLVGLLGRLGF